MKFGRRRRTGTEDEDESVPETETASEPSAADADLAAEPDENAAPAEDAASLEGEGVVPAPRSGGPWDYDETVIDEDDTAYVDLGGLIVRARPGLELRIPTESESGQPRAALLVSEDSMVELLAFAASRSGGLWDQVRPEIVDEVERVQGTFEEIEGSFGTELQIQVPAETPDGKPATRPSRIIGVDGPRWMLRATFMGREALEPDPDGLLESAVRDVVVVRGQDPMAPREQIVVRLPEGAVEVERGDQGA